MCLCVFLLEFIVSRTLFFLDLIDYFLSHVRKVFSYYFLKYFLGSFISLLFLGPLLGPFIYPVAATCKKSERALASGNGGQGSVPGPLLTFK